MKKASQPQPRQPLTFKDAIYVTNNRIQTLDAKLTKTVSALESKLGSHENYVTENLPDMDVINTAFSDINKRLLDLESIHDRISVLEAKLEVKPPSSKKKSTVKLNELTDGPGISFSP
jgi:hypothetical protein